MRRCGITLLLRGSWPLAEPADCGGDPFSQRSSGDFREQIPQPRAVSLRVGDIAYTDRHVFPARGESCRRLDLLDQVEERGPAAEGQVHWAGVHDPAEEGVCEDVADRAHVREVACLGAVAVDGHRLYGEGGADPLRDDGGVGVVGALAGAVDVEEAEGEHRKVEAVVVSAQVRLRCEFW